MTPTPPRKNRSAWSWYLVALVIAAASVAVFGVCYNVTRDRIARQVAGFQRLVAPGEGTVRIAAAGSVTIYYENKGTLGDRAFDTPRRQIWPVHDDPAMSCTVRAPGGGSLPVEIVDAITVYDIAGRQGHAMWRFDAPVPGDYQVAMQYKPRRVAQKMPVLMSVGRLRGQSHYENGSPMFIGAAALAFGGTAAVVIALVTFLATHPRKKKA